MNLDARQRLWHDTERFLLMLTVWREASNQHDDAIIGVIHCILNRAARPAWWGQTVLEICTKREQFTSMNTDANDPNLRRWPRRGDTSWERVSELVEGCFAGVYQHPFPGADSYYDASIPAPYWASQHPERCRGRAGAFYFYDMDQDVESVRVGL